MEQLFQAAGPVLLVWLVLVNVLNFALMGADKRRAKRDEWRVRERTFFVLALLGGTPGRLRACMPLATKPGTGISASACLRCSSSRCFWRALCSGGSFNKANGRLRASVFA